jgi:Cys-tRNA(Pro)/Cys-tRNA(Cys) deacylase
MSDSTPVTQALDAIGIRYRFFRHSRPVHSVEQAAKERGQLPDQVVRSILFRISQDHYVMVLAAGPHQISWSALRSYLGQSRLTLARPDEVLQVTGYPIGAVSPFGLLNSMRILVDHHVLDHTEISIGSGVRNTTVILQSQDLIKALGDVEIGDFVEDKATPSDSQEKD